MECKNRQNNFVSRQQDQLPAHVEKGIPLHNVAPLCMAAKVKVALTEKCKCLLNNDIQKCPRADTPLGDHATIGIVPRFIGQGMEIGHHDPALFLQFNHPVPF